MSLYPVLIPLSLVQFDIRPEAEAESGPQCDIFKGG